MKLISFLILSLCNIKGREISKKSDCTDACRADYLFCRLACESDYCQSLCSQQYEICMGECLGTSSTTTTTSTTSYPLCEEEFPWNPILEDCQWNKTTNSVKTALFIGGDGNFEYPYRTDGFVFCAEDMNGNHVDFIEDVVVNNRRLNIRGSAAFVHADYPTNLQRLLFGGQFSTTHVLSIIPKEENVLEIQPLVDLIEDENVKEKWMIPASANVDYYGNPILEYGKSKHEGVTCADYTICSGRNFLIGGEITRNAKSRSILEWTESGFSTIQLYLIYGRANTAAVSGVNHLCNGIFVIAGEGNTPFDTVEPFGQVTSTECFDGQVSTIIPEMDISSIFSGLHRHTAVIVRKDDQSGDDIYVLGGVAMSRNGGSASSVDRIIRFRNNENQWINAGQLLRKIAGHRSFVSYPQSTGVDSFGYFNIFTIGGEGGNDIPMQRCDEYGYCYKVETETFDNRAGASIMLFNANEFNLNYLPLYEDHCP